MIQPHRASYLLHTGPRGPCGHVPVQAGCSVEASMLPISPAPALPSYTTLAWLFYTPFLAVKWGLCP